MRALLASMSDEASMNIKDRLLALFDWERVSEFEGLPVYRSGETLLYQKKGLHLDFDDVDSEIRAHILEHLPGDVHPTGTFPLDLLVFLSKHRSEMNVDSLTVHTPGNFGEARFGGRPFTLPPSAPRAMSSTLRSLYKEKKGAGLPDRATFEVTHHGPMLGSPSFFIEIGSAPDRWGRPELGDVLAKALMSPSPEPVMDHDIPICVGIGGGHYAPRFSDFVLGDRAEMGHMIADHDLTTEEDVGRTLAMAVSATPGATGLVIHRTGRNNALLDRIEDIADELGLRIIG